MLLVKKGKELYTKNLVPGETVYGEDLVVINGIEYRKWNPFKSKLGASILKGIDPGIRPDWKVLYLGAASGTTISHVSDLLPKGMVWGIDISLSMVRRLYLLAKKRYNLVGMLFDASRPEEYEDLLPAMDFVFQDIAQKNQLEIFARNTDLFLKKNGLGMISVKARSIDVRANPKNIFRIAKKFLAERYEIIGSTRLEPYEKDHKVFLVKKKNY